MNKNGREKREWVKTAAIVFLSVMLVLTFFSSTIQNWSLPEVATQYVQSGSITAKVMITGNVESVDPYEVKVTESRKVASVAVRQGEKVQKGDVLFYLEDRDSKELEEAKKDLEKAEREYRNALLSDKYTNADISDANKGVTAEEYRSQIDRAQDTVKAAENAVKAAEDAMKAAEDAVKLAEENIEENVKTPNDAELERIEQMIQDFTKQIEFNEAINSNLSGKLRQAENDKNKAESELSAADTRLIQAGTKLNTANINYEIETDNVKKEQLRVLLERAEEEYNEAEENYDEKKKALQEAENAYDEIANPIKQREENIYNWKNEIAQLNVHKYNFQKAATAHGNQAKMVTEAHKKQLDARKEELDARQDELKDKQKKLDDLISRADNVIKLQSYLDAIDEAQKKVDELVAKAGGTTITAPIAGTISAINVAAGNETSAATPVAVMQREGQGFTLSYSATNEVAKRLSVGDVGSLVNSWRYDDVTVTLASIQPDPNSRGQNKLLTFNVTGSVVAGQSLSFSVGQKSSNYNFIVPNSAVREDNNGKFILIVTSKPSPLGTRYMASRVDVEVIANDETQSAVSGALQGYEFVITTSTKPVEAGNLVRLPD